jgi:hypothetical protein
VHDWYSNYNNTSIDVMQGMKTSKIQFQTVGALVQRGLLRHTLFAPSFVQAPNVRRMASPPQFDGEVAKMYKDFFHQLKPSWQEMLDAVDRVNTGGLSFSQLQHLQS